jgi:hypothetical protein
MRRATVPAVTSDLGDSHTQTSFRSVTSPLRWLPRHVHVRGLGRVPWKGNDMQKRSHTVTRTFLDGRATPRELPVPRTVAMNAMGPVLYVVRLNDRAIKIGYTEQLGDRLRYLRAYTKSEVELLATMPGTRDQERDVHRRLAAHAARGHYYRPTAEVMAIVNDMRGAIGLPALAS